MSSLCVVTNKCFSFLEMMNDIGIHKKATLHNQENDKSSQLEQHTSSFVIEIKFGIAQI